MMQSTAEDYRLLIGQSLDHELTSIEFESTFLDRFKNEPEGMPESLYLELDKLFVDVDMFCADDELRADDELDEEGLRRACERTLIALGKV
jgi:hypothetical protein